MKNIKKVLGGLAVLAVGGILVFLGVKEYRTSKRLVSEGKSVNAQVTDKDISYGRKGRRTYYLEVAFKAEAGGDFEKRLKVSSSEYNAATVGGTVPVRYLASAPETCQIGDKARVPWFYMIGGVFMALCGGGSCFSGGGSDDDDAAPDAATNSSDPNAVAANDADTADSEDDEMAA